MTRVPCCTGPYTGSDGPGVGYVGSVLSCSTFVDHSKTYWLSTDEAVMLEEAWTTADVATVAVY